MLIGGDRVADQQESGVVPADRADQVEAPGGKISASASYVATPDRSELHKA